jgi:ABC-type lipoprotein release transport system permease subunit
MLSTLRIAWRNLGRNLRRSLLAGGAVALGQFTLVFVNCMMAGSFHDMLLTITGPLVGHVQIQHPEWREERASDLFIDDIGAVRDALRKTAGVRNIRPRIYSGALAASGEKTEEPADAEPAMLTGLDVKAETEKGGLLEDVAPEKLPGEGGAVLGSALALRLGVHEGQQLAVIGQDAFGFPVSNLYTIRAAIDAKVEMIDTRGVVLSLEDASELLAMENRAHQMLITGEDQNEAAALAARIREIKPLADMEVLTWREAAPELVRMLDMKNWVDFIFLAILFIAAAAGIANTSLMSAYERIREFGMLLAIGARPWRIVRMVLIEAVILGLIGVAAGSLLGTAAVLITGETGVNYAALSGTDAEEIAFQGLSISYVFYPRFDARYILFGIIAATLTSVIASLWPALHAARMQPVEAMRS